MAPISHFNTSGCPLAIGASAGALKWTRCRRYGWNLVGQRHPAHDELRRDRSSGRYIHRLGRQCQHNTGLDLLGRPDDVYPGQPVQRDVPGLQLTGAEPGRIRVTVQSLPG